MESQHSPSTDTQQIYPDLPKSSLLTKLAVLPVMALNVAIQLALLHPQSGQSEESIMIGLLTKIAIAALVGPMFLAWLIGFIPSINQRHSFLTQFLFASLLVLALAFWSFINVQPPQ